MSHGIGKDETEASQQAFEQLKQQGQTEPPALVSDGWGGIREALVETFGTVPPYKGRGRPPTQKQASDNWLYLQIVKQRDEKGKFLGIKPKAIFGPMDVLVDIFGIQTAYIERAHLTMRNDCARLGRKSINFSKVPKFHKAAIIWDDVTYNLTKAHKSLRVEINPSAKRFQQRYKPQSPAMKAGLTEHIWSIGKLLRSVPILTNS